MSEAACFLPPCLPWGTCQSSVSRGEVPYHRCLPNTPLTHTNCAKLTLEFDKKQLPSGVLVETICSSIRMLAGVRMLAHQHVLVVLCDVKVDEPTSIELTIQVDDHDVSNPNKVVSLAASTISRLLSQHNNTDGTLLAAVLHVHEETSPSSLTPPMSGAVFIPVLCSLVGFLGLLSILCLIVWRNQYTAESKTTQHLLGYQRSNNDEEEVEENVTRYHNPLFDCEMKDRELSANNILRAAALASPTTDSSSSSSKYLDNIYKSSPCCREHTDIEKYEKSPFRSSPACIAGRNLYEVKATNVELSRTRGGSIDSIII